MLVIAVFFGGGLCLIYQRYGSGGYALLSALETEVLGGGGLDRNALNIYRHNLCQATAHMVNMRTQTWTLHGYCAVYIADFVAFLPNNINHLFKQFRGVDTFVFSVAIGKELADVTQSQSPKQGVAYGVYGNVAVGVCNAAFVVLYLYSADNKTQPLCKGVNIVAVTYSEIHIIDFISVLLFGNCVVYLLRRSNMRRMMART